MIGAATDLGVCLLEFEDRPDLDKQFLSLKKSLGLDIKKGVDKHLELLQIQINEYFAGVRKEFSLPLLMVGSDFQQKVWNRLLEVQFGKTKSYSEITKDLGDPKAIRAVASANGANKMAILIPCHRIMGSDGKLTGYAGGLWRKQWLLNHENGQTQLPF